MYESGKYAFVSIGDGVQSLLVRIRKDSPMPEVDKAKLVEWAEKNGFTVSRRKRLLRAE